MTALETFALFCAIITGCLALTALSWRAEQYIRRAYVRCDVAYDLDDELARLVAEEEAEVDEWLRVARAVGVVGDGSIHDALVREEIRKQQGRGA